MSRKYVIGVVGNPNCGKTTLFNALTGAKQRVGNWPGVTVERKTGHYRFKDVDFELVDLPGTYSLEVSELDISIDEQIARDYVAAQEADLIINIVDGSNLERNLYLTSQLLETKVPMLVALNMMDAARERGIKIDEQALQEHLDCLVVPTVAATGEGIPDLRAKILEAAERQSIPETRMPYAPEIEAAVATLQEEISAAAGAAKTDSRWLAVRLLEGDSLALQLVGPGLNGRIASLQSDVEAAVGDDLDICLADARYGFVNQIVEKVVTRKGEMLRSISDKIDRVVLNRALGIPIFLIVMHMMFMFTINIGGSFIDAFDTVAGAVFIDGLGLVMGAAGSPEWLTVLLANGIGGGIQVVATFIPVIAFLFLFLSILEDSGYMARAAFVMDRFLRGIGLPGKAFVPMIVGFGCTVPAVMATRTLEQERDRLITIAMSPFMSCGARLPVYALFAAAFFTAYGQYVVFLLYLLGVLAAVVTGLVLKNTLLRGEVTPFVMELPPYHIPTVKGVLLRTWDRTRGFVVRAGRVIVPMVLVLNVMNSTGTDGSFGNEDSDRSLLSEIGRTISPLFSPFGVTGENWPASVGIFTGFLAKEAVVGTLDSLYSSLGEQTGLSQEPSPVAAIAEGEEAVDITGNIMEGLATIPANLEDAMGSWIDPLGLDIGDVEDQAAAAEEQEVGVGTFGAMAERFNGAAGAFAYLIFILLYLPCVAAMAAVRRETSGRWALFVATWTTGFAYVGATLFYQVATFAQNPAVASAWIAGCVTLVVTVIAAMRYWGRNGGGCRLPDGGSIMPD